MLQLRILLILMYAATSQSAETRTATPGAARPTANIEQLSWLTGTWEGDGIAGKARETYSPPLGGTISGHFVQLRGDDVWFYELMLIREDGDSLSYCLKHFNADLTGWEEKSVVQCFPLIAVEEDAFYFDGLTVRKDGRDRMVAAVLAHEGGATKEYVFRYRRLRTPGA